MRKYNPARLGHKQSGFTLLELLMVLGIIAVLAIAAFVIYPKVQASNEANTESSNITAIAAGVKSLFASTGDYSSLTADGTATLISAKILPDNMVDSDGKGAHSSFDTANGSVVVGTDSYGSADGSQAAGANGLFDIIYQNVPTAVCNKLATGVGANFQNVMVGGTTVFAQNGGGSGGYRPDPVTVAKQCASTTGSTAMVFVSN